MLNYIRYWQASGESIKTSVRVKTRMEQLTQEGFFTGGIVPFGYKLQKQGCVNKKNQEANDLVIDEDAAQIVRFIFYPASTAVRLAALMVDLKRLGAFSLRENYSSRQCLHWRQAQSTGLYRF